MNANNPQVQQAESILIPSERGVRRCGRLLANKVGKGWMGMVGTVGIAGRSDGVGLVWIDTAGKERVTLFAGELYLERPSM